MVVCLRSISLPLLAMMLSASSVRAQDQKNYRLPGDWPHDAEAQPRPPVEGSTFYRSTPLALTVLSLGAEIEAADITDVEVADFDGDGRNDIAVAWYATDVHDMTSNQRFLTFYFGYGSDSFVRAADLDLYIPNYQIEALSIFRNGSADIGVGDFDGDGDPDLVVTPFFGDELWFIENLGDGAFEQHLKFPFGFNTTGNFQTPPEALAADFDGDGKEDLVYIADPMFYVDPQIIHFWKTDDTIANMQRVGWEGIAEVTVQWTRGLAVGDFNADDRPDLCFSGSVNPPYEDDPVLVFWYDLNPSTGRFAVYLEYPSFLCSDVVAVQPDPLCPPGVLLTDLDGTEIEFWAHQCDQSMDFYLAAAEDGYAGLAPNRGMTAVAADVDGDADPDLVTRQKLGDLADSNQVEVTLSSEQGQQWTRVDPTPIDTSGFQDLPYSEHLRPRNLAVADLFGNTLPEIVAGFGPAPVSDLRRDEGDLLRVAYWANSCVGDATVDGRTGLEDMASVLSEFGLSGGEISNPNADLNKDGQVDLADLGILLADYGCDCCGEVLSSDALRSE